MAPGVALVGVVWERGEHGLGEPFVEEGVHADVQNVLRESPVTVPSLMAYGLVPNTPRRAQHDECGNLVGMSQGDVQRYSTAQ